MADRPKVAIACQGGGSHAAFAAGVLQALLSPPLRERYHLVGLSGTSGGAMCAALAWAGLHCGGPDAAIARLSHFWDDLKAEAPLEYWMNLAGQISASVFSMEVSPYLVPAPAEAVLRRWLTDHLRLEDLPDPMPARPALMIGATDVLSGERVIFEDRKVTYDALIASAAVPFLYRAVTVTDGQITRHLWDGLFSVNPPVRELIRLDIDQLWVVQINPQTADAVPTGTSDIIDRRNELSGNIALAQELHFVHTINQLLAAQARLGDGTLPLGDGQYKTVEIRLIEAGLSDLPYESKLDRSPDFIDHLIAKGQAAAPALFTARSIWPRAAALSHKAVVIS